MHNLSKDWGKVAFSRNKTNRQINDASVAADIANDAMYHNLYWADAEKKATSTSERSINYSRRLADIEITDYVESYLNDSSERVLNINKIDKIYKGILKENGTTTDKVNATYKKYLKDLISENIENVVVVKHTRKKIKPSNLLQIPLSLKLLARYLRTFPPKVI